MNHYLLLTILASYFFVLFFISFLTTRKNNHNPNFFIANKNSKWYVVAFGMIGTTLSGVTFISVPGKVSMSAFSYYPFVMGNALGFLVVIFILMPLYYKLGKSSIYSYIGNRFGSLTQKIASILFLLSRTIGSAARLYLVSIILQKFIFDKWNIPFAFTIFICLLIIWAYTVKGGLKTIIWTDSIQTFFLLLAVVLSIYFIVQDFNMSYSDIFDTLKKSEHTNVFFTSDFLLSNKHFIKQIVGGFFVTIAMVGLDQDLMQKNLSLPNIKEAQKNMSVFVVIFLVINFLFLIVGALLTMYANLHQLPPILKTDYLYPTIALNHLSLIAGIIFMLGLIAATFSTTDSALTALTTSFCLDILNFEQQTNQEFLEKKRWLVHSAFSGIIFIVCLLLYYFNNDAVVDLIFIIASYTYAPLLALYIWGLYTKQKLRQKLVPWVCLLAPLICYFLSSFLKNHHIYNFGFEIILLNTSICLVGLKIISYKSKEI